MPQNIREVMTADPHSLPSNATLTEAAKTMLEKDIGDVIITEAGAVYGILTDRDIVIRAIAEGRDADKTPAGEICTRNLATVSPEDEVDKAVKIMRDQAIRRLPVVEKNRAVGIVSLGDLAMERDEKSALANISAASPHR